MKRSAVMALTLLLGCGEVSVVTSDGADTSARVDGGSGGTTGAAGTDGTGQAGTTGAAGTSPDGAAPCVNTGAPGFALGPGCNGEPPATATACHAACTADGAPFVGCVEGTPYAVRCYASCAACP